MVDEETSLERFIQKIKGSSKREIHKQEEDIFKKRVDRQYEGFIRLFSLMDVFVEKE